MEHENIPSLQREQKTLKSPRKEKTKTVHFQDEEIRHKDIESHEYPLITEKINQDSYLGNNFSGIPKHNIHQRNFQQGNNYFYPMMQHSKNSPSNKR